MVTLKPLDRDNWQQCANLQVSEEQKVNLPNNLKIIAELQFYPQTKAVVIYSDTDVVGLATFGIPDGETIPKIFRLMIGEEYQGKGFGKQAAIKIIDEFFKSGNEIVQVCYNPKSDVLKKFYSSLGFKEKEILPSVLRSEGKMLALLTKEDFKV